MHGNNKFSSGRRNAAKSSNERQNKSGNMKSHKFRINILNAITRSDRSKGSSLARVTLTALLLLAAGSCLTRNRNESSANPHRNCSLHSDSRTNCAPATEISSAIIIGHRNDSRNALWQQHGYIRQIEAALMRSESNSRLASDRSHSNGRHGQLDSAKNRGKRFILFNGSGVVKLVFGLSIPVQLADRQRSLSHFYNFHLQYTPPARPLYWWSLYSSSSFSVRRQQRHLRRPPFLHTTALPHDASRAFIYATIENFLERDGLPGAACLLQAICSVSRRPFQRGGGVFHALLNAILSPTLPNVAAKYLNAQRAGRFGADCTRTFNECPKQKDWLQTISYLV